MEKSNKQPQLGWAEPKDFSSHAVIPNFTYPMQGKPVNPQALMEIASYIAGMAQSWKNAEQLGQTVTYTGGIFFSGQPSEGAAFQAITSDLRIEFSPAPEFTWKDGDILNPLHLRIDTFSSMPQGFANRQSAGVRVIHLPTGLEARGEGGRGAFANRHTAEVELIRLLDERFGVIHEVR